jgi:uncharacterized membrane protein YcjF (UPF0283 family)
MFEKKPLHSKKFVAFIISTIIIAAILVIALLTQSITWPMATFMAVLAAGVTALAIGYVISQSALDKFMRGVVGLARLKGSDEEEVE